MKDWAKEIVDFAETYCEVSPSGTGLRFFWDGKIEKAVKSDPLSVEIYATGRYLTVTGRRLDNCGDQFSQFDRRTVAGGNASHMIRGRFGAFDTENTVGVQMRYDDISLGLRKTMQRQVLSTVRDDHVRESSIGVYAQNLTRWTDWLRTVAGIRGDYYFASVGSDTPANSGNADGFISSPKFSVILGPFYKTEFFLNGGFGFHSNDVRGATITVDPIDKTTLLPRVPLLVRSEGAEVGVRTRAVDGLDSAVAVFILDYDSELLFVGDAGTTEASRPSRRVGVEWTNRYKPNSWLGIDLDFAYTRARFTDFDAAGDHIPGAPIVVASAGIVLGEAIGWFGSARVRYFGPRPLIEDDSVRSRQSVLVNARAGYRWANGWRVYLDGLNLFDSRTDQIAYYYESRLRNEAMPVADRHTHPVEPLAVRLTVAGPL